MKRRLLLVDNKQIIKKYFLLPRFPTNNNKDWEKLQLFVQSTDNRPRKKSLLALAFAT